MFLCMFAIPIGGMSLGQLGTANGDIVKARVGANKLFAVQDREPRIKKSEEDIPTDSKLRGKIEFKDVSFSYPSAPNTAVLEKSSLKMYRFRIHQRRTLR